MPMLDVGDSSLFYTIKGKGTPIIFIHPPVLTSLNFKYQIEELSPFFKVVTFDIRGHGKSHHSKAVVTYPLIANDIIQLMDHLEISKVYICGYSSGGSIVLEFLQSHADRALGGIVIGGMSELRQWYLRGLIKMAASLASMGAVPLLAWAGALSNAPTRELFRDLFNASKRGHSDNIEQYYRYILEYNCTDQLGSISHPILLIYGKRDKAFHYYAKLMHTKLPNNELVLIHEVMHQIPTKAAVAVNFLIKDFTLMVDQYLE
ncbi:alpha/beta hydrolase [Virgibacillus sp. C22-A2]|uniref:Alpha/beta hydrolase n=1 Tax=Virgibacillus tibetensis TaxID=3042313 RepID=A0ABU6KF54_9BACI|nr:alpha/beta hydrolase [Virgibacillus sp. C22-A2]